MNDRSRTRRRYVAALGAVSATALAGCQGQSDADDAGTGGETNGSATTATGLSADGIEDVSALVSATRSGLAKRGYALVEELSSTGTEAVDISRRTRSSLADERQLSVLDSPAETKRVYIDGDSQYSDRGNGETTVKRGLDGSFERTHTPDHLSRQVSLGGVLEIGTYVSAGTTTRNGRALRQFDLESVTVPESNGELSASSGTVLATEDGIVFEATLSLEGSADGTAVTREQSVTVTELGTVTVERPSWVEAAGQ
ncbi:hypothetical protein [Natrinema sp. 74]|uniref:DUF7537 family lipoprotein n=1 Tax=Natrinema sp. 74 TaxID=3384159 RepID=UPI0038D3B4D5